MTALKRFSLTIGLLVFIAYLAYHALHGEQGVINHARIKADIASAEAVLAETRAQRMAMEDRVARLDDRTGAVDVDYLEERARAVLRFAHPNEIVVMTDPQRGF
ncbi:FtsB family cell division protein [Alkalicaulis satelles]|uniref:FtsB family cell division protein n=1 Tax=Alkalicaulis satelles TaxID=2609175 RepID=UPI001E5C1CC4|nr:septum formation initiator family protein [Alkalicaulis satelles]